VAVSVPSPPALIGRYALYEVIATGGMAAVHFGRLLGAAGFSRTVAVKRLHGQLARDPEFVRMLLDEGRVAARVRHPNVVPTLDVLATDDELLLVMEYVHGESLAECLRVAQGRKERIPADVVSGLICGVLHGLHTAHEATDEHGAALHIVHRDVSPQNILVGADGVPRVLDFGVAKAAGRLQTTREGQLKGKLAYMAPEQFAAAESVDRRTDVYAAGVVLWETLTRQRLFLGQSEAAVLHSVLEQAVPAPSSVDRELPQVLDAIVLRALERDPSKRFATAQEMALAIEGAVPMASATGIAQWVDGLVGGTLAARARTLAGIESADALRGAESEMRTKAAEASAQGTAQGTAQAPAPPAPAPPPAAAPAPARAKPKKRLIAWVASLGALGALTVLAVTIATRDRATRVAPPAPSAGTPATGPTTLTDLPLPTSSSQEALAAYRQGMQAMRDGARETAIAGFNRALGADPAMGAAHMRVALMTFSFAPSDARAHYERAMTLRATLSERDLVLLEAMAPVVEGQPSDFALARTKLEAAAARFPDDAELQYLIGLTVVHVEPRASAIAAYARAVALDPKYGLAQSHEAEQLAYLGDVDGALRTIDTCLREVPTSVACVQFRIAIDQQRGQCARVQTDARSLVARDPLGGSGPRPLANALYSLGGSSEAVRVALASTWDLPHGIDQPGRRVDDFALAVLAGRFDEAEREAHALEAETASSTDRSSHAVPARMLVELYDEMGQAAAAASAADAYLRRKDAWTADPRAEDFALIRDPTPVMLAALAHGHRLSAADFDRQRTAWVEDWRAVMGPEQAPFTWLHGFAEVAETPEEARIAVEAIDRYGPVPPFAFKMLADYDVGRCFLLTGRVDDALPLLRRAAASCLAIDFPIAHTRASFLLGQALETKGDTPGACAAYGVVRARWGAASPKSVTAERARARLAALGCSAR
jgi:tetratricopeptide (TPR) repeat protein